MLTGRKFYEILRILDILQLRETLADSFVVVDLCDILSVAVWYTGAPGIFTPHGTL